MGSMASRPPPDHAALPPTAPVPSSPLRVLVLGGNGYVGSHVLRELVRRRASGEPVVAASLSRRGTPPSHSEAWNTDVIWHAGDALDAEAASSSVREAMKDTHAVISCIGGFGSVATMERINGDANSAAIRAAHAQGVKRFVYISAHHYVLPSFLQRGYFAGKFRAEETLHTTYGDNGVEIRPGFVYVST